MFLKFFRNRKESGSSLRSFAATDPGIDPEARYCPRCNDEYRADIEICAGCGGELIDGAMRLADLTRKQEERARELAPITPEDDLVGVRQGTLLEIKEMQRLLVAAAIPSLITTDEDSCGKGCCAPQLYLLVRREDVSEVQSIFARDYLRTTALEADDLSRAAAVFSADAEELVCPACGCRFSPTVGACPDCGLCLL